MSAISSSPQTVSMADWTAWLITAAKNVGAFVGCPVGGEGGGSSRWSRGWGSRESSGWSRGWGSRRSRGLSSGWGSWYTKRLTRIPTGYVMSWLRTQTRAQTAVRRVRMVLGNNSVVWQRSVHPGLETLCRYCTYQASRSSSSRVCRTHEWRSCWDLCHQC